LHWIDWQITPISLLERVEISFVKIGESIEVDKLKKIKHLSTYAMVE